MNLLEINPTLYPDRFVLPHADSKTHDHDDESNEKGVSQLLHSRIPRLVTRFRRGVVWLTKNRGRRPERKWLCPLQTVPIPVVTCVRKILVAIPSLTPSLPTSLRRSVSYYESQHTVRVTLSCFCRLHHDRCVALVKSLQREEPQLTFSATVSLTECVLVFDITF